MSISTRTVSPRTTSLRARLAAAVLAIVAVTGAGLAAAAPANAYSLLGSTGRPGNVSIPTASASAAYFPGTAMTNFVFRTPGITVSRNGAVGTGAAQAVSVIYVLQMWNGRSWQQIDSASTARTIPAGYGAAVMTGHTFKNDLQRAGYYRIGYSVAWGGGASAFWVTSASNELVCAVGNGRYCATYAGYLYVQ